LLELGADVEKRDIGKDRLTEEELDALIGERDYRLFLNPRNDLYRERGMKQKPPTRGDAIRLMAKEPNLIRRPLVISGARMVLGYDETALRELAGAKKKS
jgi:arsenate reductase-like glutaredoxin family protein